MALEGTKYRGYNLIWATTLSAIGDACLVFDNFFLVGVLSFSVSLCFYISIFEFVKSLLEISVGGAVLSGLFTLILYSGTVIIFVQQIIKQTFPHKSVVMVVLSLYFLVLSTLLWSGIMLFLRRKDLAGLFSVIGTVSFYISDVLLVVSSLWKFTFLQGRVAIMVTYYTAQLLFTLSIHHR